MRRTFQGIYFALAAFHLISILVNFPLGVQYSKPLLISFLAIAYWQSCSRKLTPFDQSILVGLIFSWLGDVLLLFAGIQGKEILFLSGLGSFLLAHLFYIRAFILFPGSGKTLFPLALLIIFVYLIGILSYLWPVLAGVFMIPVLLYSMVISIMGYFAYVFYKKNPTPASKAVVWGALLFMVSDSLIALDKFMVSLEIWQVRFLIMLTYLAAQWLISSGVLKVKNQLFLKGED